MALANVGPFPSFDAARWAYRHIWDERHAFLPVAGIWIAAVVLSLGLLMLLGGAEPEPDPALTGESQQLLQGLAGLLSVLLSWLGLSSVVVFWQRRFLNEAPVPAIAAPVDRGVFAYMATEVMLALLAGLPLLVLAVLAGAFAGAGGDDPAGGILALPLTLGITAAALLLARFHLLLPAVAAGGQRPSLRASWDTTSGNTIRIVAGAIMTAVPVVLAGVMADGIFRSIGAEGSLTGAAIATIIEFVQVSVMGGYLAFSYRFFLGRRGTVTVS